MDPKELVPVYTVSAPAAAEIIKNFLHAEGIRSFIENEDQAGLEGLSGNAIRILVPAERADEARKLIRQHELNKKM
jgi:hypothetical protein